jgi:hypothetical protein
MPSLLDPVRRRLIWMRFKALVVDGADPHEAYLGSYFLAVGIVYAWPGIDSSAGPRGLNIVHDYLGGDAFMAAAYLPLGVLLGGCALRPLIASITLHRAALLTAVGINLFLAITGLLSFALSPITVGHLLIAVLAMFTFIRLDRV